MEEDIKHICNEIYQGERWQLMIDFIKDNYIPKSKVKEVLDITATVLGDKYELDYQDIQDAIAETISKIKQQLLQ